MAKLSLLKGSISQAVNVFIQDSSVTTGAGKTGLVFNTASLTAYFVRPKAAAVAIVLVTQTVTGAFASGGFVEIDATNMPGTYRLDIPDAALATGVGSVVVMLKGAADMSPLLLEIELTATDNQDAVSGGITNTAAIKADTSAIRTAVVGPGAVVTTITVEVGGNPADGVEVWASTDSAGVNVIAGTLVTNALGKVVFMLDAGTYFLWKQKAGVNFTNPETIVVTP